MARAKPYEEYVNEKTLEDIKNWKLQGQIDEWIYKKIGVGRDLAIRWKKAHKEFDDAFKKGKEELLLELEQTLYTRAKGYYITEVEEIEKVDFDIDTEQTYSRVVKRTKKTKYVWSDQCLMKALSILCPEKYREGYNAEDKDEKVASLLDKLDEML